MLFCNEFCMLMLGRPSALSTPPPQPLCISKSHVSSACSRVGVRGKWEVGSPCCSLAPARPRLSLSPFYTCVGGVLDLSSQPLASESSHLPWPLPSPSPPRLWPAASPPSCASRGLLMHARFFAWSLGRRERHHLQQPDCPPCPP